MGLIYTDRSRREDELQQCPRKRYWKWHSVNGYGIEPAAPTLELLTGIYVHEAIHNVLKVVMLGSGQWQGLDDVSRAQIRPAIRAAVKAYIEEVKPIANFYAESRDDTNRLMKEQVCLIEGMAWAFVHESLPALLQQFELVAVENEEWYIIGCSCGVGDGHTEPQQHAEDCSGVCYQSRPDVGVRDRAGEYAGQLGLIDWKTLKRISDYEVRKYRNSVQFATGCRIMEARVKEPVTHYYVWFFGKGERKGSYNAELKDYSGPRMQQSHYCYVDYKPANPPLTLADVETGGVWYKKSAVWEIELGDDVPPGWTRMEYITEKLGKAVREKTFTVVGPYPRQNFLLDGYFKQVYHHEQQWNEKLWRVYEKTQAGMSIADALDEEVPQSWDCFKYTGENEGPCPFWWICHKEGISPENPVASGTYRLRVPHHEPERVEMEKQRGEVA